jgi:hypothetical protein
MSKYACCHLLITPKLVKVALDIRGLFICEFVYSYWQKWPKMTISRSKKAWKFKIRGLNNGTYLPRITRETCIRYVNLWRQQVVVVVKLLVFHVPLTLMYLNLLFFHVKWQAKLLTNWILTLIYIFYNNFQMVVHVWFRTILDNPRLFYCRQKNSCFSPHYTVTSFKNESSRKLNISYCFIVRLKLFVPLLFFTIENWKRN